MRDSIASRLATIPILVALRHRVREAALVALAIIPVSAIVAYSRYPVNSAIPLDYPYFGPTGAELLRGRWDLVYQYPNNAGGPFEIVPYGIAYLLHVAGPIPWTIFYTCLITVILFALGLAILAPIDPPTGRKTFLITLGIAAIGLFMGTVTGAAFSAHIADLLVPLLWVLGSVMARDRNFVACGITIGLSAGFESWGVLGFVLVFVVVAPRLIVTAVAGISTVAVIYLPFVATGTFRMFDLHWPVFSASIYSVMFPQLHQFSWELRVLQALFAVAVAFAVALLTRRSAYAVTLAPVALIAARLVLDPLLLSYYWVAPSVIALVALAVATYNGAWIPVSIAALVIVALWLPKPWPLADALGLLLLALIGAAAVRARESRRLQAVFRGGVS